jgi:hypothetical protein
MSLTQFVSLPAVKQRLAQEFQQPLVRCRNPIRVPPRTKSYSLVGTSFDYLLRFWLKWLNPTAEAKPWVAEAAVNLLTGCKNIWELPESAPENAHLLEKSGPDVPTAIKKTAVSILRNAKQTYSMYLKTGDMTDEVIRAAIHLAQLDPIYRALYIDSNLGNVEPLVLEEVKELFSFVEPDIFEAIDFCALNPTFGEASLEVGGADADMVIDGTLIDIKTTKSGKMDTSQFHQLVGYYLLAQIGGINGDSRIEINQLGIYYSRYGELLTFPIAPPLSPRFPELVKWFRNKMRQTYNE